MLFAAAVAPNLFALVCAQVAACCRVCLLVRAPGGGDSAGVGDGPERPCQRPPWLCLGCARLVDMRHELQGLQPRRGCLCGYAPGAARRPLVPSLDTNSPPPDTPTPTTVIDLVNAVVLALDQIGRRTPQHFE